MITDCKCGNCDYCWEKEEMPKMRQRFGQTQEKPLPRGNNQTETPYRDCAIQIQLGNDYRSVSSYFWIWIVDSP